MPSNAEQREPRGRIVVGTDGSPASRAALRWALEAAAQTRARLDVVLVWGPSVDFGTLGDLARGWRPEPDVAHARLADLLDGVAAPWPETVRTFVMDGDPALCLMEHASGADVLVLADRGAGGFLGLRLGSVASDCAAYATCPVVIVPGGRRTPPNPSPTRPNAGVSR